MELLPWLGRKPHQLRHAGRFFSIEQRDNDLNHMEASSLLRIIEKMNKELFVDGYTSDIKADNIMLRGDTLVFIDLLVKRKFQSYIRFNFDFDMSK